MSKLSYATIGAALLASVSGTAALSQEVITMVTCGDGGDPASVVQAKHIAEWTAMNEGYAVEEEYVPWGQCQPKVTTLAAAGDPVGLSYLGSRTLKELALNELIVPMSLTEEEAASYAPPILGTVTWNGEAWGVPRAFSTKALFFNKDLFSAAGIDAAPTTWDEMLTAAKAVTENTDAKGVGLAAASFDNTMHQFLNYMYSNGGAVIDEAGEIVFDSPNNVETMEFIGSLVPYAEEGPVAYDVAKLRPLFHEKQISMFISGPWERSRFPEDIDWGVTRVPAGPSGKSSTLLITDSLAVFNGTGVEDAALSLAKYLTSPEKQMEYDITAGWVPIRTGAATDELIEADPTWAPFIEGIADGGPEPFVTDYTTLQTVINEAIQGVVLGEVDPAEAVEVASEDLEDVN